MKVKRLINDPLKVTIEELEGFASAYSYIVRRVGTHAIIRKDAPIRGKVAILGGGGSGHEPVFIGYVGYGMCDGAVLGEVFAAPTPPNILEATRAVNGGAGVIYIYGNYAGDNMNFGLAAQMVQAEGVEVEILPYCDDISSAPPERKNERRGIAGGFYVYKCAGAAAEILGADLKEVRRIAEKARENVRSFGVALAPGTIPVTGKPTFELGEDEIYFGIGAHGEKGVLLTKIKPADEVTEIIVNQISREFPLKSGDEVNVLVNGCGSTTMMELYIVARKATQMLRDMGVEVHRMDVGNFLTTQEMAGVTISILRLDEELKELCDAPAYTPIIRICPDLQSRMRG
ncbi:MAG: dihydroxyacetone kinase subunit DhaK [Nitrososphaerota archaeon]